MFRNIIFFTFSDILITAWWWCLHHHLISLVWWQFLLREVKPNFLPGIIINFVSLKCRDAWQIYWTLSLQCQQNDLKRSFVWFLSHGCCCFWKFNSLETVSLIILSNIYSNKVFWEYVFNECFLTVPGVSQLLCAHSNFSSLAMTHQNHFSVVERNFGRSLFYHVACCFKAMFFNFYSLRYTFMD